ncbi:uncharacterized protein LOC133297795 [Gastrolobium bilobum]|uniref:uncharacterized protein LOC133297795 n=1 Tax=Gastrolobium bilobum TaxID=150636 RepID=UPI002AB09D28|nr:uncharacterized protein LOC133297795 [Gastrolobium bilobum]
MEDSGAILAHISSLKEMLDQVNEEIETNIQITREIESSIVRCEEIESDLATRESELIKTSGMLKFDTVGYVTVAADFRASVSSLEEELCCLKMKRDEIVNRMDEKRENFTALCLEFQREIDKREKCEVRTLLSEKDSLENEIQLLDKKNNVLKNSVLAFVEEILEDLQSSNSGNVVFYKSYEFAILLLTSDFNREYELCGDAAFLVWMDTVGASGLRCLTCGYLPEALVKLQTSYAYRF